MVRPWVATTVALRVWRASPPKCRARGKLERRMGCFSARESRSEPTTKAVTVLVLASV